MTLHEKSKRKISEAEKPIFKKKISSFSMTSLPSTEMGSSPTSTVSSPSARSKFSPDYTYGSCMRRDTFSCTLTEDIHKSTSSKTSRFRDFVSELLMKHDDGDVVSDDTQNSMSLIHGYPVLDLVYLIGDVFREEVEITSPTVTPRMHQLLLKALITRCLQVAFQDDLTVLVADNMQWCDIPSAAALVDLIGCIDSGFGVLCYRSTIISRESENKVFSTLRGMCYSVPLPPLKSPDITELVRHIVGSEHQSAVTKEMITRILARTQGNPGLIEVLVTAFRAEADKGLNPNIEDIRTPVSHYTASPLNPHDIFHLFFFCISAALCYVSDLSPVWDGNCITLTHFICNSLIIFSRPIGPTKYSAEVRCSGCQPTTTTKNNSSYWEFLLCGNHTQCVRYSLSQYLTASVIWCK